jgi:formylglycine-generating enzyme required for sulfatase activity
MGRSLAALSLCGWLFGCAAGGIPDPETTQVELAGGTVVLGSRAPCTDAVGPICAGDRAPHPVTLSPFRLDRTEVTWVQFLVCVQQRKCDSRAVTDFDATHRIDAWNAQLPVRVNDPEAARSYCAWKGLRLPSEAELEFAARGAEALTTYPWGDEPPTCDRVPFAGCGVSVPRPVGTTPGDISPQGIADLAGSVPEWVEDSYTPLAECVDRVGYGDLCGDQASCANARCADDGAACIDDCVPSPESAASTMNGPATPQCAAFAASPATTPNPVSHANSGLAVVRGGRFDDRACDLAGYTRRNVAPSQFAAGFRCARFVDPSLSLTDPPEYRFRLQDCPAPDALVSVSFVPQGGAAAPYRLAFYPSAPGPTAQLSASDGMVSGVPCDGLFVLSDAPANTTYDLNVADATGCATWAQTVALPVEGTTPATGADSLSLMLAANCACDPVAQTGCPVGHKCRVTSSGQGCIADGTVALGQACNMTADDCIHGMQCIADPTTPTLAVCRRLCNSDADCTQPTPAGEPGNVPHCLLTLDAAKVCTIACNPVLAAGGSGCASGLACTVSGTVAVGAYTDCYLSDGSSNLPGSSCSLPQNGCAPGSFCAHASQGTGTCREICRTGTPSDCSMYTCSALPGATDLGECCPPGGC